MKKILFYSGSLRSGGAERQMINLAILLKNEGYHVEFFCLNNTDEFYVDLLHKENIKISYSTEHKEGNNVFSLVKYFLRLKNELKKTIKLHKYDVVITFLETCNTVASLARREADFLLITGERNAKVEKFTSIKGKFHKYVMRYSDYIVCNSQVAKTIWLKYYPQYKEKLRVIYNSLVIEYPKIEYQFKSSGRLKILVASSIKDTKNPIGLIEGLNLLSHQDKDKVEIHWYGSVTSKATYQEMQSLISKYHLENVVFIHPPTKQIHEKMKTADVVALFSKVEGLPNAILEGMALAKPIIMSRVSDYEVLIDDTNGKLCDWDNPESIKDAILYMVNKQEQDLLEMGIKSKEKIDNLCSKEKVISSWGNLIEV